LETLLQDIRYGVRKMLVHKPGVTVRRYLRWALGNGARAAIFSVVNTVLFGHSHMQTPIACCHDLEPEPAAPRDRNVISAGIFSTGAKQNSFPGHVGAFTARPIT